MPVRTLVRLCLPAALIACDPDGEGNLKGEAPEGEALGGGFAGGEAGGDGGEAGGAGGEAGGAGGEAGGDGGEAGGDAGGETGGETGGDGGDAGGETGGDGGETGGEGSSADIVGAASVSFSGRSAEWTWEGTRSSWCAICDLAWDGEFSWEAGDFGADFSTGVGIYTYHNYYVIDGFYNIWGLAYTGGGSVAWDGSLFYYYGYIPYNYTGYGVY